MRSIARILGVTVALLSLSGVCALALDADSDALATDSDYIPLVFNTDSGGVIDKAGRPSFRGRSFSAPRMSAPRIQYRPPAPRMTAPRVQYRPSSPPSYGSHAPRIRTAPRMPANYRPTTHHYPTTLPTPPNHRVPHPVLAPRMTDEQRARYFGTSQGSQRTSTSTSTGRTSTQVPLRRQSLLPQSASNATSRVYTPSSRAQTIDRNQSSVRPDLASTNTIGNVAPPPMPSSASQTGTMTPYSGGKLAPGQLPPRATPTGTLPSSRTQAATPVNLPSGPIQMPYGQLGNPADHRLVHPDPFPGVPTEPQVPDNRNPLSSQFTRSQPAPGFTPAPARLPDFIIGPGFDPWASNQIRPVSRPTAAQAMKPMRGLEASSPDGVGLKPVQGELIGGEVSTSPGLIPGGR